MIELLCILAELQDGFDVAQRELVSSRNRDRHAMVQARMNATYGPRWDPARWFVRGNDGVAIKRFCRAARRLIKLGYLADTSGGKKLTRVKITDAGRAAMATVQACLISQTTNSH